MAANEMSFNQISTVLNAIHAQATGTQVPAAVDTASFVTQAQAVLKTGYDPIMSAVSQVLSRTIFSIRPYSAKFRGMMVSPERYGNHVRKLNIADKAWANDDRNTLTDGNSVDQQTVNVPNVVQTNFYGENVFQKSYTIFRDQLDVAFSSPEELQRFVSLVVGNANDMLEQSREELARSLVANYIGAKYVTTSNLLEGSEGVVHLLTEYNTATGLTEDNALTATTVYQPANFKPFMQWVYARIATLSALLTERSARFHLNMTLSGVDKTLMRHTPYDRQRVYLFAPARFQSEAMVLADTFKKFYDAVANGQPAIAIGKELADDQGRPRWTPFQQDIKSTYIAGDLLRDLRTIENRFDNDIGIPNANTEKRERMIVDEVNANNVETYSKCELWLEQLRESCERANAMFPGLALAVEWRNPPESAETATTGKEVLTDE